MSLEAIPVGPDAVLVDLAPDAVHRVSVAITHWLATTDHGGGEAVPAAQSVLVIRTGIGVDARRQAQLVEVASAALGIPDARDEVDDAPVELPIVYDGEDVDDVARMVGCSPSDVIGLHLSATYRVAFCGFAPGFAYLVGLPRRLHVTRRASPRSRVPAGSVAIAAGYCGVYPRSSPGGWHLLGRTGASLWSLDRDSPSLLTPGTRVRFVEVST